VCVDFLRMGKKSGILILRKVVIGSIGVGSCHLMLSRGIHESEENRSKGTPIKIDDCEIPACHSTKEMMKLAKQKRKMFQQSQQTPQSPTVAPTLLQQEQPQPHPHAHHHNPYQSGCPVMREHLGVSTWNLIHTIAANFPENPNEEDKNNVRVFFKSLASLYPCPHCAEDFQNSVLKTPPE
jgi:hypothetical protein